MLLPILIRIGHPDLSRTFATTFREFTFIFYFNVTFAIMDGSHFRHHILINRSNLRFLQGIQNEVCSL